MKYLSLGVAGVCLCGMGQVAAFEAPNLLKNANFEEIVAGNPRYWSPAADGKSQATLEKVGQNHRVKLHKVNDGTSIFAVWHQMVKVQPDTAYWLSGTVEGCGRLFWYEYDENKQWVRQIGGIFFAQSPLKKLESMYRTSPRTHYCDVRFEIYGKNEAASGAADDIALRPVSGSGQPPQSNSGWGKWTEYPFVEKVPLPQFTASEQRNGLLLFSRELTKPIYPQTRPLPHERVAKLQTFAAQQQIAVLNFAILPLQALSQLEVEVKWPEKLQRGSTVRRIAYGNYAYPHWTSEGVFRRLPSYGVPATPVAVPRLEPQRYLLNIPITPAAAPGRYQGEIHIRHAKLAHGVVLPFEIEVLPFKLERDPGKHFSAYAYQVRQLPIGRRHAGDEKWLERAALNDCRKMVEYGFTCPPSLYLVLQQGKLEIAHWETWQKVWRQAGLAHKRIVALSAFVEVLYQKYMKEPPQTSGEKFKMPPPEFFTEIETLVRDFVARYQHSGDREFFVLGVDEPLPFQQEYVIQVYAALKKGGLKTFITSCPFRDKIAPWVDVWSDQTFDSPEVMQRTGHREFWNYPNHHAYEMRDPEVRGRGGRMTYGFGLYRSNYTMLMPWMWSWWSTSKLPELEFGGQKITPQGEVVVEWEWDAFREGIVDGAYFYTLQQEIRRHANSSRPEVQKQVAQAQQLLTEILQSIPHVGKYLSDNHWRDAEFDLRRKQLADQIVALKKF